MTGKVTNVQLQQQMDSFSNRFEAAMKTLTEATQAVKVELGQKMDEITTRLDGYGARVDTLERDVQHNSNRIGELTGQIENGDLISSEKFRALTERIVDLEEELENMKGVPDKVSELEEKLEDRTNRQLRETLVFKNIPEGQGEVSYDDTKELLATIISTHCTDVSYDIAFNEIKRAHRESKKNPTMTKISVQIAMGNDISMLHFMDGTFARKS